ncbi:MAG TPA: hypothetical protein V6D10_17505 [Trichocoleus sp.]|jgi:very-short-patch-repair endonuclease
MSQYPIVLIPPVLERAQAAEPVTPALSYELPIFSAPEPKKIAVPTIAAEAGVVTVASSLVAAKGGIVPGLLLFLAASGAIATQVWRQAKRYKQGKQDYERQLAEYKQQEEECRQQRKEYLETVKQAKSPEGIAKFRYELVCQALEQVAPHDSNGKARRGWTEKKFGECLRQYFDNKIQEGLQLKIPDFNYPYTVDFGYVDPDLNLYIDIEIDEPYAYGSKEPLHCLGAWKDNKRNQFFLERGWIVIRFCEEQIARYPQECCKAIAEEIADILSDKSILEQFSEVPSIEPMPQWTRQEAEKMAKEGYRDQYLKAAS